MDGSPHEQTDLRLALAETAGRWAEGAGARHAGGEPSNETWREIADLGWLGILAPEEAGGIGLSLGDLAVVAGAFGAANRREPISAVAGVAVPLLAAAGAVGDNADLLGRVIAGEAVVAFAHGEPAAGHGRSHLETVVTRRDDKIQLRGRKSAVEAGAGADVFLVTAWDGERPVVVLVPRSAPGLSVTSYRAIDDRELADLDLAVELPADAVLRVDDAAAAIDAALDRGALLAMAEAAGAMGVLFEDTVTYLKTRQQFGQPLARFQALQHRVVDMSIALEEARAVVEAAADHSDPDVFARAVAVAKVVGARSARRVSREAVQLHGGIGITSELRVSHLFRRLVAAENAYGDDDFYLDRFITLSQADDARPASGAVAKERGSA